MGYEDQPRDDHGMWTTGGSMSAGKAQREEAARHGNNALGAEATARAETHERMAEAGRRAEASGVQSFKVEHGVDVAVAEKVSADLVRLRASGMQMPSHVSVVRDGTMLPGVNKSMGKMGSSAAFVSNGTSGHVYVNADTYSAAKDSKGYFSSDTGHGTLAHEIGHAENFKTAGSRYTQGADNKMETDHAKTAGKVSRYAKQSYGEFYAEYRAGVVTGKTYSDDVHKLAAKVKMSGGVGMRGWAAK